MHFPVVYIMFGCKCNVLLFMQCFGVDAFLGCVCNVQVLIKWLGVDAMLGRLSLA